MVITKKQYNIYRGLPKEELGQFADLRGNLAKRGGGFDTPLKIMECFCGFMSVNSLL